MASVNTLPGAIRACLSDSHFSATASRLPDTHLRNAVSQKLAEAGLDVVVVSAKSIGDREPYSQAEIVWQPGDGGDFVRQTIRWKLAPWTVSEHAGSGSGLRALRLIGFGRS